MAHKDSRAPAPPPIFRGGRPMPPSESPSCIPLYEVAPTARQDLQTLELRISQARRKISSVNLAQWEILREGLTKALKRCEDIGLSGHQSLIAPSRKIKQLDIDWEEISKLREVAVQSPTATPVQTIKDVAAGKNKGGKPRGSKGDHFLIEVIRIAHTDPDGLPDREKLRKQMDDWIAANYEDDPPADSQVRMWLAAIDKAIGR
jgi:hypothetical protein